MDQFYDCNRQQAHKCVICIVQTHIWDRPRAPAPLTHHPGSPPSQNQASPAQDAASNSSTFPKYLSSSKVYHNKAMRCLLDSQLVNDMSCLLLVGILSGGANVDHVCKYLNTISLACHHPEVIVKYCNHQK